MILANDFQRQWQDIRQDALESFQRVGERRRQKGEEGPTDAV